VYLVLYLVNTSSTASPPLSTSEVDFEMADTSGQELTSAQLAELYRVETSVNVDAAGAVIHLSPAIATFLIEQGQVSVQPTA
jgi:hypothetical protein